MNVKALGLKAAVLVPLLLLAGCKFDLAIPVVGPAIRSVVAEATANAVFLDVIPDTPSVIEVEYWTTGEPALINRTSQPLSSAKIPLLQLRPGREYQYDVRTVSEAGVVGPSKHGVVQGPAVPAGLANLNFTATGTSSVPLVMLEINGPYSGFVAVNSHGEPVWQWHTEGNPQGFTKRANGNFVFLDGRFGLFEVSPAGEVVHQLPANTGENPVPHHDVVATPRNTLLFIAQESRLLGNQLIVGDAIWEWSPESSALTKRWTSFDFYDPYADAGPRSSSSDWLHANSLAFGDHGNVILSLNWISQVISIAPDWQTIEWRIGGPHSTITLDPAAVFQGQHTASMLPNGHLLVFDNGRDRVGSARVSRALEIAFDSNENGSVFWSFSSTPLHYDPFVGSARRLANGNTLVFFGMRDGFVAAVGNITAMEVRPDGSVAWQLAYDGGNINYRATPLTSIGGEEPIIARWSALRAP